MNNDNWDDGAEAPAVCDDIQNTQQAEETCGNEATLPVAGEPSFAIPNGETVDAPAGLEDAPLSAARSLPDVDFLTPDAPEEGEPLNECFIGVSVSTAGPVYFIPKPGVPVSRGDKVLLQLEHGPAFGEVTSIRELVVRKDVIEAQPATFKGMATAKDVAQHAENRILSAEASVFCATCIRQRDLDMKLVDVEVLHDRSKLIFYFTAPVRIDFRELVKDLVSNYRTRIELRQIGVRHETQMIGGIGNCGMVCCCHRYLRKFAPVTIKMAKEQNLFLNPAKLSGMCGRLLCCLSFEQENYEEFNRRCPKLGKNYATPDGVVRILRANMFRQIITVLTDTNEERDIPLEEWQAMAPKRAEAPASDKQQPRRDDRRGRNGSEQSGTAEQAGDGLNGFYQDGGGQTSLEDLVDKDESGQSREPGAQGRGNRREGRPGQNGFRPQGPARGPRPGRGPNPRNGNNASEDGRASQPSSPFRPPKRRNKAPE